MNIKYLKLIQSTTTPRVAVVMYVLLFILILFLNNMNVQASPGSARNAIRAGWEYYVPGDEVGELCSPSSVSTSPASDDVQARKEQIWAYLRNEMGLSAPQAAGVMGNLIEENSEFNPILKQGGGTSQEVIVDGSTGYGIAQWTFISRQQYLKDFAEEINQSSGSMDTQLRFITEESAKNYSEMLDALTATSDAAEAARIWHGPSAESGLSYSFSGYETSGDGPEGIQERVDSALAILNELGDATGSYVGAPVCIPVNDTTDPTTVPSKDGWAWPIAGTSKDDISFDYGEPGCGSTCGTHKAIDLPASKGTDVLAAHKGVVSKIVNMGSCGYATLIKVSDIEDDLWMEYQHVDPTVSVGDEVALGAKVGDVGTFCGSGYHLHFGISLRNSTNSYASDISYTIDPKSVLP